MKKITNTCPRCGKQWSIGVKEAHKLIECPHCHKQMCTDTKTQRKMKYTRYFFMLVLALLFSFAMKEFTDNNNIIFIGSVLVFSLYMASISDELCRKLAFWIFKFSYIDIDEYAKVRKKTIGERMGKK